ncbi:hypothetical protein Back2_09720 [Nocardioides baekrokdamisoli]|uniref:DUF3039 domain-containing protein n=1 Tax=Nocardioides baekrokdamisoli TaxID=1804624 RepID=A0A3G9IKU6_9ACTN|nr:DUF3039 domain-containing protein [Nocardioides baekrokdamisoli]BBH16685.1 hypothetical protein Back2_09720 [Nocardioides baekrokdamisoli]
MGFLGFGSKSDTAVKERTDDRTREVPLEEGDHDRFSHYVDKDTLTEAMVMGYPVVGLCGKVWVPSRDGAKFPVCPECKEIWEGLPDDSSGDKE